ncbi:MAG TPA: ADP-ribosylglycohydrolase family protein [Gemmatimonadales bacterium]|nr:ADP-ribosylglycohydrolase family protein [Gemmatimonadales bacterium]
MIAPDLSQRARGALLGAAVGGALAEPVTVPSGAGPVAAALDPRNALTVILAEELLTSEVDLRRLAHRWAEWAEVDGRGLGQWTRMALEHIRRHDAPVMAPATLSDIEVISWCLPVALKSAGQPANLVSGTYHTAALTHPDERVAWGAVAINVTAACFLSGRRDFIGDVLEALRENGAPPDLLAALRRVPAERRTDLAPAEGAAADPTSGVEAVLWLAYHEPSFERGLIWLSSTGPGPASLAAAGGLMGTRDGEDAIPWEWRERLADRERLRKVATRLVGGTLA